MKKEPRCFLQLLISLNNIDCETSNSERNVMDRQLFLEDDKKMLKKFDEFASLTHTLSNFMLVPINSRNGFNTSRANLNGDNFFTVLHLKNKRFLSKNGGYLDFIKNTDSKKSVIFWLEKFGTGDEGFKNFLKDNFLPKDFENEDFTAVRKLNLKQIENCEEINFFKLCDYFY